MDSYIEPIASAVPVCSQRGRHKGAKKRLAQRVRQILDAGVPEQTIHTALAALLSPKPIGVESFIGREIMSGPFSSNVIEDMGSDWPALEEIDPEFIYTLLGM